MKLCYDEKKCTGCQACQMACLDQRDIRPERGQNPLCRLVLGEDKAGLRYRFLHCVHCGACMRVCPTGGLYRDDWGLVQADPDKCLGCRACGEQCPFQVMAFHLERGTVIKCDGCIGRVEAGLLPACVHTCPTGALTLETD